MVRRGFRCRKRVVLFLFFLIQSQVMFIKVEMIAVQWSDWFHVSRDKKIDLTETTKTEREREITQLAI